MALIIKLSDDYGSNYYGPFELVEEVTKFVDEKLAEHHGTVEDGKDIYILVPNAYDKDKPFKHRIGRILELNKDDYKPLSLKDGH